MPMISIRPAIFMSILLAIALVGVACTIDLASNPEPVSLSQAEVAAIEAEAQSKGLTSAQLQLLDSLGNQGPTPELTNEIWLNSEPLQLADLRGNVVIVEFWTYG